MIRFVEKRRVYVYRIVSAAHPAQIVFGEKTNPKQLVGYVFCI